MSAQPRNYDYYEHNLTRMGAELDKIMAYKYRWMKLGHVGLFRRDALLVILVGALVLGA